MLSAVRWCVGVLGAAAVLGSMLALAAPVALHAVDRGGQRISCGTGLEPLYETAAREDAVNQRLHDTRGPLFQPTSYTDDCEALISERRSVGLPAAVLGTIGVLAALSITARRPVRAIVRAVRHDAPTDPAAGSVRPPVLKSGPPGHAADPGMAEPGLVEEAVGAINRRAGRRSSLPQA
ncbi:hypothetical protein [Mycolicibacterium thermoresistibile]